MSLEEMNAVSMDKGEGQSPSEVLHESGTEGLVAWDDLTGDVLDPKLRSR